MANFIKEMAESRAAEELGWRIQPNGKIVPNGAFGSEHGKPADDFHIAAWKAMIRVKEEEIRISQDD